MNRAIKFRAWHKRLKRMYPVRAIDFAASPMEVHLQSDAIALDTFLDKRDVELMQFTGMLDKNGRDIYEGDIVAHVAIERTGPVFYREEWGCFSVKHQGGITTLSYANLSETPWEIIGNIYETPELLKESNDG